MIKETGFLLASNMLNFKDLQYQIVYNQQDKSNTIKSFNICYKGKKIKKFEIDAKWVMSDKNQIEDLIVNSVFDIIKEDEVKTEIKKSKKQKVDKKAKKEAANELLDLFNLK